MMEEKNQDQRNQFHIKCHSCDKLVPIELMNLVNIVRRHSGGLAVASPSVNLADDSELEEIICPSLICYQCYSDHFLNEC